MTHLADDKEELFVSLLGKLIPLQARVSHSVTQTNNVNLNLNMPLAEMISNLEQKIKAAVDPRMIEHEESPSLMIEHNENNDA